MSQEDDSYAFLHDGEMGRLMRAHDWASTPLGPIATWPQSLKTATGILLRSPVPIVMLWGEDGVMIYNDAYSVFAGNRHPRLLGSKVLEGWPEVADFNANVMKVGLAGGTLAYKDQELVLDRNGRPEPAWMDLDYSPVPDESGRPAGVIAIVVETTERVLARRRETDERARLSQMFEQAPSFICTMRGPEHVYEFVNAAHRRLFGSGDWIGKPLREAFPDIAGQGFYEIMDHVYATGERYIANAVHVRFGPSRDASPEDRILDFVYEPMRDDTGAINGVFCEGFDVTDQRRAEEALRRSQARMAAMLDLTERFARLTDPDDLSFAAAEVLGQTLGVGRAGYGVIDRERETISIARDWNAPGVTSLAGTLQFRDYGSYIDDLKRGDTVMVTDARLDPRTAATAAALEAITARSFINMPVTEDGGFVALLYVNHAEARDWSDEDLALMREVAVRTRAAVERRRAEAALRASEARLRFLDELGRETARSPDADDILAITTRMVGEHMGVTNCAYADMDEDEDGFTIRGDWAAPGSPSIRGHYSLADFGKLAVQELGAGRPLIVNDNLAELAPEEAATFQAIGIGATICMPLVKDGRLTALMAIHDKDARTWTAEELALISEITERSWAHIERVGIEAALRESEARYRTLFESIDEGFCLIEMLFDDAGRPDDYRFLEVNPAFVRQTGLTDAVGRRMKELAPAHEAHWFEVYGHVAMTGEPARFENRAEALNRWYDVYALRVGDPDQHRVALLFNDISERRASEIALRELNERLEERVAEALAERRILADIVEGTNAFVQVVDLNYRWLAINHASADEFERIYGVRPRVGDALADLLPDQSEQRAEIEAAWGRALAGETFTATSAFGAPGPDRRTYEMRFNPLHGADGRLIGAYQFAYDITDRLSEQARLREAEEALHQSQKMETIGQLTGGVAHDFNNLLTPIVGALDVLRRRLDDERAQRLTAGALQAADRARTLVQRLLAFSRRQHLQPRAVDIRQLTESISDLVSRSLGPRIRFMLNVPKGLPPAHVDPNQLELALLNLAVNARDAMEDGGDLTITARVHDQAPPGRTGTGPYICIAVTDTGSGMDAETLKRAVEPFYTTKGVGRGTGLGLSSVQGLAVQSGGAFTLESEPGKGATATLWLPVSTEAVEPVATGADAEAVPRLRHSATVLLVDDEELVRAGTADMLAEAGYDVIEAASGLRALQLLKGDMRPDAVITDYAMPGMTGAELAREVAAIRPGLPVLLITGYASLSDRDAGGLPRLSKPFRQTDLAATVAELIEGGGRVRQ